MNSTLAAIFTAFAAFWLPNPHHLPRPIAPDPMIIPDTPRLADRDLPGGEKRKTPKKPKPFVDGKGTPKVPVPV